MNILLFQKVVPSYRVGIFRKLYQKFGLMVCHSLEKKGSSWPSFYKQMDFPNILLKRLFYRNSDTAVIQRIFLVLIKQKPEIVICEFALASATFWLLWFARIFFKYKLAIWTHGIKNDELNDPFKSMRGKLSLFIYQRMDAVLFYSYKRRDIAAKYIKKNSHLFVAPNTLDTDYLFSIRSEFEKESKIEIRNKLGIKSRFVIVYSGRLLKSKRIDLLLQTYALLSVNHDVELHIIGDGPEMVVVKEYQKTFAGIVLYGAIYDERAVGKIIYASDLMLMPGYIGLSLVNCFALGVPVISCISSIDGPFHSPEIEYLQEGYNGDLTHSDPDSLFNLIDKLFNEPELLLNMSENATNTAKESCNIDQMAEGFDKMINYLQ
jgi:glycosyltransferase involved in cell wall biosynthesis